MGGFRRGKNIKKKIAAGLMLLCMAALPAYVCAADDVSGDVEEEKADAREEAKIGGGNKERKVETSLIEEFIYPKFGPGQLWETVAEEVKKIVNIVLV